MPHYEVRFFTGDYTPRQSAANAWGASLYVEQHLNDDDNPAVDYTTAILARESAGRQKFQDSMRWARRYCELASSALGLKNAGPKPGGYGGRGEGNVRVFKGPAILVEPCFGTSSRSGPRVKTAEGVELLAVALVASIREVLPQGGKVALSIGHKGKTGRHADDTGSKLFGGGWEADVAEAVLKRVAILLTDPVVLEVLLPGGKRFSPVGERGRTLIVPARPIGEALGVVVDWNPIKRVVEVGGRELERVAPPDPEAGKIGAWVRLDELGWALGLELVRDQVTGQIELKV